MKCRRQRPRMKPSRKPTALRIFKVVGQGPAGQRLVVLDRVGPVIIGQVRHRLRIGGLPNWNAGWINSHANCAN
jgi:hypothetical protein